jgi:cytochrome c556
VFAEDRKTKSGERIMRFATALAAVAVVAFGATAVLAQQDPIAARKPLMKANGQNAAAVGKMIKGETPFDAATAQAAFAQWAETADKMKALFPENSQIGETRALPAIWTDRAKFEAAVAKFAKDVADNSSKATSLDGLKAAISVVGNNCRDCHEAFRKPQ